MWRWGTLGLGVLLAVLPGCDRSTTPEDPPAVSISAFLPEGARPAEGSEVRVEGEAGGQVVGTEREHGGWRIQMQIDPEFVPLDPKSTVFLRQKTLLDDETFVEITSGLRPAPGPDIPGEGGNATLEEVFDSFDPETRRAFRAWRPEVQPP